MFSIIVIMEKVFCEERPQVVSTIMAGAGLHVTYNVGAQDVEEGFECFSLAFKNEHDVADVALMAHNMGAVISTDEWREIAEYHGLFDEGSDGYGTLVNAFVSAEYPADKMQAIINNRLASLDSGVSSQDDEYCAMQSFRREAKNLAKSILFGKEE